MRSSLLQEVTGRAGGLLATNLASRLGPVFGFLRWAKPVTSTSQFAALVRDGDVREVLARREDFTVALYGTKMEEITGPFILGMDDMDAYRHDHVALRRAVRTDDLPRLKESITRAADSLVARAMPYGRIDVVTGLVDPVLHQTIADYFGTPGPDPATMLKWARLLFQEIFINVQTLPALHDRAMVAAGEMRAYLDELISERKEAMARGESAPDDVLGRLLRAQGEEPPFLDDVAVRTNLLGLIVGWIPTVSKALTLAIEELIRRPAELQGAQRAAVAGDDRLLAAYLFEALRFRPQNVGVIRQCAVDSRVPAGSRRGTKIRAGATVLAVTQSAMMDASTIEAPEEFRLDRPWGDYLHFGYGLHTCFGEQINRMQIPAIAKALFRQGHLSRVPGRAGRLSWKGPYPSGLSLVLRPVEEDQGLESRGSRSRERLSRHG